MRRQTIFTVNYRHPLTFLAAMILGTAGAAAQGTGGEAGGLELPEEVVITGETPIVLPPARKGEVFDTIL